ALDILPARPKDCAAPAIPACGTSRSHQRVSGRHYSSLPRPASAPPPRCRLESSPTAPVDRWLRADHPSQTTLPTASPYRRTQADPSAPPDSCRRASDSHSEVGLAISRGALKFDLDASDWHGHGSETLWAAPVRDTEWRNFRIMNSPFFTRGISYLDTVRASPTGNRFIFDFDHVVERGGHSTYMVVVHEEPRFGVYWSLLETIGCTYESMHLN